MGFKLCTGLFLLVAAAVAQDSSQLQSVKKIYVDQLGDTESASNIRDHIIKSITQSTRFASADSADAADAVMSGRATVESKAVRRPKGKTSTSYHFSATLQLVDKNKAVLWSADKTHISHGRGLGEKYFAESIVKDLVKAATPKKP